jgi:hypothetical protein
MRSRHIGYIEQAAGHLTAAEAAFAESLQLRVLAITQVETGRRL